MFLNGEELGLTTTGGEPVVDDSFVVLLNATPDDVAFRLPPRRFGLEWELELSTAQPGARSPTGYRRPRIGRGAGAVARLLQTRPLEGRQVSRRRRRTRSAATGRRRSGARSRVQMR